MKSTYIDYAQKGIGIKVTSKSERERELTDIYMLTYIRYVDRACFPNVYVATRY